MNDRFVPYYSLYAFSGCWCWWLLACGMRLASYGEYYNDLCSMYTIQAGVCIKIVEFWLLIFMP